jgi:hypothetical protein
LGELRCTRTSHYWTLFEGAITTRRRHG